MFLYNVSIHESLQKKKTTCSAFDFFLADPDFIKISEQTITRLKRSAR